MTHHWEIELRNKQLKTVAVGVRYSCHCYTRSPKANELYDQELVILDHTKVRLFDLTRYELSKSLPELLVTLPDSKVFHTGHHNLVRIQVGDVIGHPAPYFVFLSLKRKGKSVDLHVESAYPGDLIEDKEKYTKPIRFRVALRNAFEGR